MPQEQNNKEFTWDDDNTFFGQPTNPNNDMSDVFPDYGKTDDENEDKGKKKKEEPPKETKFNFDTLDGEPDENDDDPVIKAAREKALKDEQNKSDDNNTQTSDQDDNSNDDNGDNSDDDDEDDFYTKLAQEQKENGILQFVEIPKDKKLTKEEYLDLTDEEFEGRAKEIVDDFFGDIDQVGKDFLRYKRNGGKMSTQEFLQKYSALDVDDVDLNEEEDQDYIISQYITKVEGETDRSTIQDRIDYYKESGKKKNVAEKFHGKLKEIDTVNKQSLLAQAENDKKIEKEKRDKFIKSIETKASQIKTVGDFSFATTDMKQLVSQITRATEKVGENRYVTPLQKKLAEVYAPGNEEKLLLLTKILMSDFNTDDVVIAKQTKKVDKAEDKLRASKNKGKGDKNTNSNPFSRGHSLEAIFGE